MNQQIFNIGFEKTKKACNDKQSGIYLIAKDVTINDGKKEFARIEDFNELHNYINMLLPSERCFYECIETGKPVKLHFDYDYKGFLPEDLKQFQITYITDYLINTFEPYDITMNDIVIIDSSDDKKTSMHFVLNKIHFKNIEVLKYLRDKVLLDLFKDMENLDTVIYRVGCFRMPLCTKYGQNRHLQIVSEHSFIDALVTYIPEDSKLLDLKEDIPKVITPVHVIPESEQSSLEQCFNENVDKFIKHSNSYDKWISVGIKLHQANCSLETFKHFSKLSDKYNEEKCIKKWESFSNIPKNSNSLLKLLRSLNIELNLGDDNVFLDTRFYKNRLREDMIIKTKFGESVNPIYSTFVIKYINRFFCVLKLTKTEYFQIEYNEFNKPCKLVRRYGKQSLMDANDNIDIFLKQWLFHRERLEYADVDFEPDFNIPLRDDVFNLYFGLKIEMMHNITSYEYDQELVDPFINHVTKYFCKGNTEHADYMLNWMAHIVQKPSTPTMVAIVIKSEQGIGKGLIFDILLGDGIFGQETYLQVKNVEGLLGHFNSNIMNELLINVNEVSMTKKEANEVKSMITDKTISAEAKFLNKITVKNCSNYVLTSNNDYCVYLDEGNSDRR